MKGVMKAIAVLSLLSAFFFTGCDLLEVSNPNSLVEEDLNTPEGAAALKNGLLNALMDGMGWAYAPLSAASDELRWDGSYESYRDFQIGELTDPANEITNNTFPILGEARWLADEAIDRISKFEKQGGIDDPTILTKTYIYSALTRITIGNTFENFVYSDKRDAGKPIGESNMSQVYNEAISHLDKAVSRARSNGNKTLEMQALGLRARAKYARAVWNKLNPPGSTPSNPLVSQALRSSGAADDARAALKLMPTDYEAEFDYLGPQVENYLAGQVNGRNELDFFDVPKDPKTGKPDPRIKNTIAEFTNVQKYSENFSPLTWISAREMRLIIAEAAMGQNDAKARTELNELRAMNNLPPIEQGDNLIKFLEHERRANLFLQGRRLLDMYRFGTESPTWLDGTPAKKSPGTVLPIPASERQTNPNL
ncbi:MAG: RagB/SusD family nutrient uptake outer membrane protein [Salinibacter sp.]